MYIHIRYTSTIITNYKVRLITDVINYINNNTKRTIQKTEVFFGVQKASKIIIKINLVIDQTYRTRNRFNVNKVYEKVKLSK